MPCGDAPRPPTGWRGSGERYEPPHTPSLHRLSLNHGPTSPPRELDQRDSLFPMRKKQEQEQKAEDAKAAEALKRFASDRMVGRQQRRQQAAENDVSRRMAVEKSRRLRKAAAEGQGGPSRGGPPKGGAAAPASAAKAAKAARRAAGQRAREEVQAKLEAEREARQRVNAAKDAEMEAAAEVAVAAAEAAEAAKAAKAATMRLLTFEEELRGFSDAVIAGQGPTETESRTPAGRTPAERRALTQLQGDRVAANRALHDANEALRKARERSRKALDDANTPANPSALQRARRARRTRQAGGGAATGGTGDPDDAGSVRVAEALRDETRARAVALRDEVRARAVATAATKTEAESFQRRGPASTKTRIAPAELEDDYYRV